MFAGGRVKGLDQSSSCSLAHLSGLCDQLSDTIPNILVTLGARGALLCMRGGRTHSSHSSLLTECELLSPHATVVKVSYTCFFKNHVTFCMVFDKTTKFQSNYLSYREWTSTSDWSTSDKHWLTTLNFNGNQVSLVTFIIKVLLECANLAIFKFTFRDTIDYLTIQELSTPRLFNALELSTLCIVKTPNDNKPTHVYFCRLA